MKICLTMALMSLLLLTSCKGGGASDATAPTSSLPVTTGTLYAKLTNIQAPYTIGYDLAYSCTDISCDLSGEIIAWPFGDTSQLNVFQISSSTVAKTSGVIYTGTACNASNLCYSVKIDIGQNVMVIDDGTHCTRKTETTTLSDYDIFKATYANNVTFAGSLFFHDIAAGACSLY
jgi:hypothetical protein